MKRTVVTLPRYQGSENVGAVKCSIQIDFTPYLGHQDHDQTHPFLWRPSRLRHRHPSGSAAGSIPTENKGRPGFLDLRDRAGSPRYCAIWKIPTASWWRSPGLRREDCIGVEGKVRLRDGGANDKLETGAIELVAERIQVFNKSKTPPILPGDHEADKISEDKRLEYRYIDLRRPSMQKILRTRSQVTRIVRDHFGNEGFLEVENPFLIKSSPEGTTISSCPAGGYPASGTPQSPQIFKQILMISGCDRYLQIVRCFRDEDPRATGC